MSRKKERKVNRLDALYQQFLEQKVENTVVAEKSLDELFEEFILKVPYEQEGWRFEGEGCDRSWEEIQFFAGKVVARRRNENFSNSFYEACTIDELNVILEKFKVQIVPQYKLLWTPELVKEYCAIALERELKENFLNLDDFEFELTDKDKGYHTPCWRSQLILKPEEFRVTDYQEKSGFSYCTENLVTAEYWEIITNCVDTSKKKDAAVREYNNLPKSLAIAFHPQRILKVEKTAVIDSDYGNYGNCGPGNSWSDKGY